jgi:hypothetical protein
MFDAVPEPAAVAQLLATDPDELRHDELVDYHTAIERLTSHLAARSTGPLVRLLGMHDIPDEASASGHPRAHLEQAAVFEEVRTSLRLSDTVMRSRLEVARALSGEMMATAQALNTGQITALHARTLVEGTRGLSGESLRRVELLALQLGRDGSLADMRRGLRKGNAEIDAETQARRHDAAMAGREVRRWALDDGMAVLQIVASAIDVDAAYGALTVLAGPNRSDDPRTLSNRRVDAFVDLCMAGVAPEGDPGSVPPSRRPPVQAQIVIDLTTLLGMDDKAACLRGHGPIAADVARIWLQDATTWRRLVVDPVDGHLLDFGPLVHDPPPRLDRFVRARDQRCVFPGCNRSAIRADLDHQVPFRADGSGGSTSAANLAALCRRHHRLKTHAGWSYVTEPDGSITWTSPSGRTQKVLRRPARE